jgi:16S rRNA (guanine966-N2)-methyltransferase
VRVISGTARGLRLSTPKDLRIRPTSDRVKESLFNILTVLLGNFSERRVLDVFAGTGNLGIEALSRGATHAVFIDENREAAALVKKNLELAGFTERGRILQREALSALKSLDRNEGPFCLVFIDPPYREGLSGKVLEILSPARLIDEHSIVIAETAAREELPSEFGRLREFDRRVYGDTALVFFKLHGKPGEM